MVIISNKYFENEAAGAKSLLHSQILNIMMTILFLTKDIESNMLRTQPSGPRFYSKYSSSNSKCCCFYNRSTVNPKQLEPYKPIIAERAQLL